LLLSTKRASSNSATASSGILSNKGSSQTSSKPLPVLGLQYESNTSTQDALLGAVIGASRAEAEKQPDAWGVADKQQQHHKEEEAGKEESSTIVNSEREGSFEAPQASVEEHPSSNWDEYGGRNASAEKMDHSGLDEDVQGIYMSQRAKERAEKRRTEEESRFNQQKERAAQRLRELDKKAGMNGEHQFGQEQLAEQESGMPDELPSSNHAVHTHDLPRQQKTLYDPNRPYSSMLGGGTAGRSEKEVISDDVEMPRNSRMMVGPPATEQSQYSRQPMIQLSSYEDRDRGERGSSAGPRMLYDPKSGSMVAVPSREDATSGRGRKERGKKGRNARDKESKADGRTDNENSKWGRKGKQRRDDSTQQRGKVTPDSSSPVKAESKLGQAPSERRLPRTCGVLYAKESKGHYYCVDGSDGDLGYGAHSTPGGKTRKPEAYDKFVNERKQAPPSSPTQEESLKQAEGPPHQEISYKDTLMQGDSPPSYVTPGATLQTGFNLSESAALAATALPDPSLDWVKPNERISLGVGVGDYSPTLQATAKEWAPSRAALTAAAAAVVERTAVMPAPVDSVDEDDEEVDDAPLGLGFDPTLHMDSMMHSPSAEPTSHLDTVDFAALSLEPAMHSTGQGTHNIFAFESGATWGASNSGGHNDWGYPSSAGNAFASSDSKNVVSASFLSLSNTNTWDGVPGISGTTLGGSPMNEPTTGSAAGD